MNCSHPLLCTPLAVIYFILAALDKVGIEGLWLIPRYPTQQSLYLAPLQHCSTAAAAHELNCRLQVLLRLHSANGLWLMVWWTDYCVTNVFKPVTEWWRTLLGCFVDNNWSLKFEAALNNMELFQCTLSITHHRMVRFERKYDAKWSALEAGCWHCEALLRQVKLAEAGILRY